MSELLIHRETLPAGVTAHSARPRILLRLEGDADVDHAVELAAALDALTKEAPGLVILDLSGVPFISSMGIGTLFTFSHAVKKAGGEARLASARPDVAEALRRCRAEQVIAIFPTVALASA